ncbi:MAG: aldo/keto reductase [Pseudomonadota bacterium]
MRDILVGCMGLGGSWDASDPRHAAQVDEAHALLDAAMEVGLRTFDHADIYKHGRSEAVFGEALTRSAWRREDIRLQTKCGIRFGDAHGPKRYDWSPAWIIDSVEGSLRRLQTDYIDTLLLHRPDLLMQPDEIADAFDRLHAAGKVRRFGVSNLSGAQIAFLQRALSAPLVANQIELHLLRSDAMDEVVTAGQREADGVHFTAGTLEYCREHNVEVQCWGSLCQGLLSGRSLTDASPNVVATAKKVAALAREHGTAPEAIVLAWLGRHPMGLVPVIGTTNPARVRDCAGAREVTLSREDWYALWVSARGTDLP